MNTRGATQHVQDGMTLMELLVASLIGFIIILAVGHIDVTRIRMSQDVRARVRGSGESSLALASIVKDLERSDRIRILTNACGVPGGGAPPLTAGSCVQIRIPEIDTNGPGGGPGACPNCTTDPSPNPCCLNIANNYRWVQYAFRAASQTVDFYNDSGPVCNAGDLRQTFTDLTGFTVSFMDEAQAPLGALGTEPLPGGEDNNVVRVQVQWVNPVDPATPYSTTSEVVLRATPYTNVPNGLDVTNVSPPPTPCT